MLGLALGIQLAVSDLHEIVAMKTGVEPDHHRVGGGHSLNRERRQCAHEGETGKLRREASRKPRETIREDHAEDEEKRERLGIIGSQDSLRPEQQGLKNTHD